MDGGEESLDEEYDFTRKLTAEQTLGVMNQLLCFEVSTASPEVGHNGL